MTTTERRHAQYEASTRLEAAGRRVDETAQELCRLRREELAAVNDLVELLDCRLGTLEEWLTDTQPGWESRFDAWVAGEPHCALVPPARDCDTCTASPCEGEKRMGEERK
jgi:hypothetical protein